MRPKAAKRNGTPGMLAPAQSYDPMVISQMQSAIDSLSAQLGSAHEQIKNANAKIVSMQTSASTSGERTGYGNASGTNSTYDRSIVESEEATIGEAVRVVPAILPPEDVSTTTPSVGTSKLYARADHVHYYKEPSKHMHLEVETKSQLSPSDEYNGAFGYVTSTNRIYTMVNSTWLCLSHAEVE